MKKKKPVTTIPPIAVKQALTALGQRIRIARLRRGLRLVDVAERVGASRIVISAAEKGKSTVAISTYLGALWVLGLLDDVSKVADPDHDMHGKTLESLRAPKTAAKRKQELDN